MLEDRAIDLAVIPYSDVPARFHLQRLYEEDFVIAMRDGHLYADDPTLDRYCAMQHMVVSLAGDPNGFVDEILASHGRSRRIALTVPNFMFALAVLSETDLLSAMPRRLVDKHGERFRVSWMEAPLPLPGFSLNIVAPKAALMDPALAWLLELIDSADHAS